jgi:hypothetical protein
LNRFVYILASRFRAIIPNPSPNGSFVFRQTNSFIDLKTHQSAKTRMSYN